LLWATVCGGALLGGAIAASLRWDSSPFVVSVLVEVGAATLTVAAFGWLSRRVMRAPTEDRNPRGHTYAGPIHPHLRGRWLVVATVAGCAFVAAALALFLAGVDEVWSSILLEIGIGIGMVGILAVVEVLAVLALIDPAYRPRESGDLCYRATPPSPVQWTPDIEGPVYQCSHDPHHWYPAILADFPDLDFSLPDLLVPGWPGRRIRTWRKRWRQAFRDG
jgi:hypothetical protein